MVAIPVYDAKLQVETVRGLLDEKTIASAFGDDLLIQFLPSCSHAAMGRNQLAQQFMDSDCDRLVFLDADVTFEPGALLKIAKHDVPFVGGAYRFKIQDEAYPVGWLPDPDLKGIPCNKNGLLAVASLPGGFLSLSKEVFQKLKEAHPERQYEHFGKSAHCWFQMLFTDGHLYGEDSYFCKEWRDLGGVVFLDPEIELTHWEFNRPFKGHIGNWLRSQTPQIKAV